MFFRSLVLFTFISIECFSAPFLFKDIHIPASPDVLHPICFCTTRALDDGSLKTSLLQQLKTLFEIEAFVETGTYLGKTTIKAAEIFDEVHTIELSRRLYLAAAQHLKTCPNVTVHWGDSKAIFQSLLPTLDRHILFYLDGHYSGHVTARGSLNTPILHELQAIEKAKKEDSILLIDDIRLFQDSCFPEKIQALNLGLETYPDLEKVIQAILKINPDYQICFLGDALLAFPRNTGVCVSPVIRSCALHRLEHLCIDLSDDELQKADLVIGRAEWEERKEIAIYYQIYSPFELDYGYRSFACLWHALTLRENGCEDEAQSLFRMAASRSLPRWRVEQCIK